MRKSKSLIYMILTLLPCALLLLTLAHGLLADQTLSLDNFQFGSVTLTEVEEGIMIQYTENSITASILFAFIQPGQVIPGGTALSALFRSMQIISNAVGFSQIPAAVLIACVYLIYWVFLYFTSLLVDFMTLIPKLVERMMD